MCYENKLKKYCSHAERADEKWWPMPTFAIVFQPSHMTFMCISTYMVYKTGYGTMFFCNLCICGNLLKGKNYYSGHSGVRLYFYKWCILKFQMTAWQDFVPHKAILTPGSPGKVFSKIILTSVYRKLEKITYRVFFSIFECLCEKKTLVYHIPAQ